MLFTISVNPAKVLTKIADERETNSLSSKLRKKRFIQFKNFVESYVSDKETNLKIIDIGGTPTIWENNLLWLKQLNSVKNIEITVANIKEYKSKHEVIKCVIADATNMQQFKDKEFDIVFSNSVIEHVGDYKEQTAMANEILRIGKKYFVQTPNYYFPVEPHFLFPFFQFMPLKLKVWLITNFDLGWRKKTSNRETALMLVNSVKLLTKKELMALFPGANVFEEKVFSLTKSFIMHGESP
ncbi:methyltransferase domain-containing protein [Gloeocapsopsis dulcis]|uniref:Methyltransferase type 11 n=1 Tax=Gloeocapsopsis dulcis AAB1 = 1H9 TaxID=1433147 RepID=A0A6N8G259_9CHRO|nr:methyltransferase domain-containing protein [Gloeocapsopsis dulcis]MUL38256.1 methyltransferase type 11 [Gloeocapsopsis dulcis AAB1 = 1H9]WNN89352.1 methyltransferase domain-containing protein [Gloeocapsopsis dulcis]